MTIRVACSSTVRASGRTATAQIPASGVRGREVRRRSHQPQLIPDGDWLAFSVGLGDFDGWTLSSVWLALSSIADLGSDPGGVSLRTTLSGSTLR
jgi:hypothetical protein